MIDFSLLPATAQFGPDGRLRIGGCALEDVAAEFGTPALVIDEQSLRLRAREYVTAFRNRHPNTDVHFASKAFPSAAVLATLAQEGISADVASGNELAIALAAGLDPKNLLLHGNAKADDEIVAALTAGIGYVVIDNLDDVDRLERLATGLQPVLLRVTPGIDAHTYDDVATGHLGSKFGIPIDLVPAVIARIRAVPSLRLDGLHAHIGSQIFDVAQFREEVAALATLERFGVYDLGGGLGARYTSADPVVSVEDYAEVLVSAVHEFLGPDVHLIVEPGRSMVANSGVTVYTVVTVKRGHRVHVAVDGGMGDNLEVSLYHQPFQPILLDRDGPIEVCDLVGHHCESGDQLVTDATLPTATIGDRVVVPVTGAYTFTMSNNYNGAFKQPVIFCRDGKARIVVRRETMDDLLRRELTLTE
jgi:diaminopimelate decarboxylase